MKSIYSYRNYRTLLQDLLNDRKSQNPAYSLRAFAAKLKMSPSHLSEILKGSKNLSRAKTHSLVKILFDYHSDKEFFKLLVELENIDSEARRNKIEEQIKALENIMISEPIKTDEEEASFPWYFAVICSLVRVEHGHLTPEKISDRLGITYALAKSSLKQLVEMKFLNKTGPDQYEKGSPLIAMRNKNSAAKQSQIYAKQMLELAIKSIGSQPESETFYASYTFSVDKRQIPRLSALIDRFMGEFRQIVNESEDRTEVYHLGSQLFQLTKSRKN